MSDISTTQVHEWVSTLHTECENTITTAERNEQQRYATMIQNKNDKIFLSKMLDESSQIRNEQRLARRIKELIDQYGVPKFFGPGDTLLMKMFQYGAYHLHWPTVPIIKKRLRSDTAGVIINEERPALTTHLAERYKAGIGQNVNLLGEVVLGNSEANHRYHHYLDALEQPDINYISVKISGIYAQLHPLNFRHSRAELIRRLSALYQKAIDHPYIDAHGTRTAKFVNLDMEEYKDAHLTLDIFKATLSLPQFTNYTAGIVVQAYLPDAQLFQSELLEFAKERVANGGAYLKMRLVKGANLQMESVISSLRGWPNPVRTTKTEVDANYLHLLDIALQPENAAALHLGVASHNLFTIAYANLVAQQNDTSQFVTFEMLEGMANHLWRAMTKLGKQVILYTPVVSDEHFLNAVSYLVRRLDENTGPENFLSYSFNLKPDTKEWAFLSKQFQTAYSMKDSVVSRPTRTQDRNKPYEHVTMSEFRNEPDTDFDLQANQLWAESIVSKWKKDSTYVPVQIPVQVGSTEKCAEHYYQYTDRCNDNISIYSMGMASGSQISQSLQIAHEDPTSWRTTTLSHRTQILHRAANLLGERRGDLIGCMCAVTGKTITEGDVEVSEAIDFARFYPLSMETFDSLSTVRARAKGVVLVVSPWNFPLAIPVGGVSAALSCGNTVILKPATVAAPVAWEFAQAFWDAGVPREVLQVVITDSRDTLAMLTKAPCIKHIILTGGTDTAQRIQSSNPHVGFSAETGGKNAIILTEGGDRDKAIMNATASAFGNAGQKCSACSLFLVQQSIFNDPSFKDKLRDATTSLQTGSVWELNHVIGPMITDQNDKLIRALDKLEGDQEWLVAPEWIDDHTLRPTVKWGVEVDSYTFRTELFAPVLSVVPFETLQEAIDMVNSLDYGLTSGLQSLDENEQHQWMNSIEAGNLYINRGITGAIVNRQPFGGMKLSAFGGGLKAGGPNYVTTLLDFEGLSSKDSFATTYKEVFSHSLDINNLYGEQNFLRYLPVKRMVLRVMRDDSIEDIRLITKAAITVHSLLTISIDETHPLMDKVTELGCAVRGESLEEFIRSMGRWDRIRTCSASIPGELYRAAAVLCKYIATAPAVAEGRIELLHYLKEQSVSFEYHRYGSITETPHF